MDLGLKREASEKPLNWPQGAKCSRHMKEARGLVTCMIDMLGCLDSGSRTFTDIGTLSK